MAVTVTMYKKDLLPILRFHLKDRNGNCIDLSQVVSVTFAMGLDSTSLIIAQRACTITDPIGGKAEYTWQTGDTNLVGDYQGEVVVNFQNGKPQSAGLFTVSILDSLRP